MAHITNHSNPSRPRSLPSYLHRGRGRGGVGRQYSPQQGYRPGIPPNALSSGVSGPPLSYASAAPPSRPGLVSYPSSKRSIFAIADLSPCLNRTMWTIRARVTLKPPIRPWRKGKVLNVNLADDSGEIRATCWNDAAEKYAAMLKVGKVYYISRGYLKKANKKYSEGVKNDYALTFTDETCVEVEDLPGSQYNLTPIANIENDGVNAFNESSPAEDGAPAAKRRKNEITAEDIPVETVQLSLVDLKDLHCRLHPISDKWYSLGVQLHVPIETLKCIRGENRAISDCLLEMLTSWLKRTNPPPTWKALAKALERPPVAEGTLSQQLRDRYCQGKKEPITTNIYPTPGPSPAVALTTSQGDSKQLQAEEPTSPEQQQFKTKGELRPNDFEPTSTPTRPPQQPFKTESMLLFEEAMKQGHIEVCIIKCLLFGTAGVGKTCLLHLLLDKLPPTLRQSTACIEQAIRAICVKYGINSGGEWQKVDSDRLRDLLGGSVSEEATSIMDSTDPPPANSASLPHGHEGTTASTGASTGPGSHTMEDIFKQLEKTPGARLGKLQDLTWIYLVDSGGQPQFHELLTTFLRNASVGIFVHKLSESLDDHPHVKYFDKKGEQCGKGYRSPLSNRDILQHCIQTMQSLPYTTDESICPQLAIVGTHRDEEHQCKGESRDGKNKQLLEILRQIQCNVFRCKGRMDEVIFPVNTKFPDPEDKAIAKQLRQTIESLKPKKPEVIPLKWYGLELELEREAVEKKRLVFTRDECLQVAKRLHFPSDKAVDAALMHLDKLNIFLYYPSILPELLFCSPCVLQDKISELVEESYNLKHDHDSHDIISGEFTMFCHLGRVTAQLLQKYPKHYAEFFTPAHLLKLFESLLIVAPIDRNTYFMPSLLDVLEQSEFRRPSCGCPLVIFFKDGYAPLGLFSSLIASLLSDKNKPNSWVVAGDSPKLYRNHITLALSPYPGSVTLIDRAAFFEVHVTISLPSLYKHTCRYVSRTVERGLKEAIKARNFQNVRYQKAISCPCDEGDRDLHPALLSTAYGTQIWQCSRRSDVCGPLDEHHLVWMENHTGTETFGAGEGSFGQGNSAIGEGSSWNEQESSPTEERTPVTKRRKTETAAHDTPVETVELTSDDHVEVTDYLLGLEKTHIYHLGLVLGLSQSRVKSMMDTTTFLDDVIGGWLRREDQVNCKGVPMWKNLVKALRHPRLQQTGIADKIVVDKQCY